jgi:hypothetical protein
VMDRQRQAGLRAAGRSFAEDVLEAVIWEAVEEVLLDLRPGDGLEAWAAGLEDWGRELLSRWPDEVAGFVEAFAEDEASGRLDRVRRRLRSVARRSPGWTALAVAALPA